MNTVVLNIKGLVISVNDLRCPYDKFISKLRNLNVKYTLYGNPVIKQISIRLNKDFRQNNQSDFDKKFNEILTKNVIKVETIIWKR